MTNDSGTSKLTISTTGPSALLPPVSKRSRGLFYAIFLPILGMPWLSSGFRSSKKKSWPMLLLCLTISGLLFVAAWGGGNGGGGGTRGSPPGTYTISISGSAGSMVNTTKITMTAQ